MLCQTKPDPHMLSFVKHEGGVTCFWVPDRSGTYGQACARGRGYARELQEFLKVFGNPTVYGSVVRDITTGGAYGAVEIGFCHEIGVLLIGLAQA